MFSDATTAAAFAQIATLDLLRRKGVIDDQDLEKLIKDLEIKTALMRLMAPEVADELEEMARELRTQLLPVD